MQAKSFALAIAVVLLAGCGMQPVPLVAVEGTTIAIPVPANFEIGYGRRLNAEAPLNLAAVIASPSMIAGPPVNPIWMDYEDLQRGEVVAILWDDEGYPAAMLRVRYVAGLNADSATGYVRDDVANRARQNVLLVEIPRQRANGQALVSPVDKFGTFSIELRRYRRHDLSSNSFDLIPQSAVESDPSTAWLGWAAHASTDPSDGIKITVLDRPTELANGPGFTNETAYQIGALGNGYEIYSAMASPQKAIPDPHFAVQLDPSAGPYGAFEFDLNYPAERMEITAIRPNRGSGWAAITHDSGAATGCGPESGTARVHVADSEGEVSGVFVNFKIKSTAVGCSPALPPVAVESEIAVATGTMKAFDLDGADLSSPTSTITENGI